MPGMSQPPLPPGGSAEAFFVRDGARLLPTEYPRGPWSPHAMHGGPPAALLVTEALAQQERPGTRLARASVEILGPVPLLPLTVTSTVSRAGRSVELVDAALHAGDREVLRARLWRIRTDDGAGGAGGRAGRWRRRCPRTSSTGRGRSSADYLGYHRGGGGPLRRGRVGRAGPATAWFRLRVPLVLDEPLPALARVLAVVDSGNGIAARWTSTGGCSSTPSLVVHLRAGAGRGVDAGWRRGRTVEPDGVGLAETAVSDVAGAARPGRAVVCSWTGARRAETAVSRTRGSAAGSCGRRGKIGLSSMPATSWPRCGASRPSSAMCSSVSAVMALLAGLGQHEPHHAGVAAVLLPPDHAQRLDPVHQLDRAVVAQQQVLGRLADGRPQVAGVAPHGQQQLVLGVGQPDLARLGLAPAVEPSQLHAEPQQVAEVLVVQRSHGGASGLGRRGGEPHSASPGRARVPGCARGGGRGRSGGRAAGTPHAGQQEAPDEPAPRDPPHARPGSAMTVVRRLARPLLAVTFLAGGVAEALRNPGPRAALAADSPVPMPRVPQARSHRRRPGGAGQRGGAMVGGRAGARDRPASPGSPPLLLAGSLVPTTAAGHRFWEESDPTARAQQRMQVLKNAGLLGGLLLAAVDTEGRESLPRRARRAGREGSRSARRAGREATRAAALARRDAARSISDTARDAGRAAHRGKDAIGDLTARVLP